MSQESERTKWIDSLKSGDIISTSVTGTVMNVEIEKVLAFHKKDPARLTESGKGFKLKGISNYVDSFWVNPAR